MSTQVFTGAFIGKGAGLSASLCVLILAGCAGQASKTPPDMIRPEAPTEIAERGPVRDQGIEIMAYAMNNIVRIELVNRNEYPILVGPKCFAVVPPGQAQAVLPKIGIDDFAVPIRSLPKDQGIQGHIRFNELKVLLGGSLLFQTVEPRMAQPIRCPIQEPPTLAKETPAVTRPAQQGKWYNPFD